MAGRLPRAVLIPVVALSLVAFGWRLNTVPITTLDEGIYTNVNLELFRSHDWIRLTYFGENFSEKPPLFFWLTMPVMSIFGPTELAMRFWTLLAAVGTVALITIWAWQVWNNKWFSWLAGGLFIFGRYAQVHAFRTGDLDGLLTLFITLAIYAYWRATLSIGTEADRKKRSWLIIFGAATGLAIMTKSFVGLLPLIIAGLDTLIACRWRHWGWRKIGWSMLVLIVIVLPWHIIETIRFGHVFWDNYFGVHVLNRTTESLFTSTPWHYYFGIIHSRFFPFSLFVPLAIIIGAIKVRREKSINNTLWLTWIVATFVVFTIIQTRFEWYILPLYPAAVLLVTQLLREVFTNKQPAWFWWLSGLSLFGALYYLPQDIFRQAGLWKLSPYSLLPGAVWEHVIGRVVVATTSLFLLLFITWCIHRRIRRWSWNKTAVVIIGLCFGLLSVGWTGLYVWHLPRTLPLKTMAAKIKQLDAHQLTAVGVALKDQPAGYFYLLRLNNFQITERPSGVISAAPLVLTTTAIENKPTVAAGNILFSQVPFVLLASQE